MEKEPQKPGIAYCAGGKKSYHGVKWLPDESSLDFDYKMGRPTGAMIQRDTTRETYDELRKIHAIAAKIIAVSDGSDVQRVAKMMDELATNSTKTVEKSQK
jgi:hypothetical protein